MKRPWAIALLAAFVGAALATRLPGPGWSAVMSLAASVALTGFGLLSFRPKGPAWARTGAFASLVALLATPTSPHAALVAMPAAAVALLGVVLLHSIYGTHQLAVPTLAGAGPLRTRRWRRILPAALLLAAVLVGPWLAQRFLPDRLAAIAELRGPAGPLLVALSLLVMVWAATQARDAFAWRPNVAAGAPDLAGAEE